MYKNLKLYCFRKNDTSFFDEKETKTWITIFTERFEATYLSAFKCLIFWCGRHRSEKTKKMEQILNFEVPAEGLELVILLHTQY